MEDDGRTQARTEEAGNSSARPTWLVYGPGRGRSSESEDGLGVSICPSTTGTGPVSRQLTHRPDGDRRVVLTRDFAAERLPACICLTTIECMQSAKSWIGGSYAQPMHGVYTTMDFDKNHVTLIRIPNEQTPRWS